MHFNGSYGEKLIHGTLLDTPNDLFLHLCLS
jgi:hypothetical protein